MIERNEHYCSHESISNFKKLLKKNDMQMFFSPYLNYSITNEVKAHYYIRFFVDQVNDIVEANDEINHYMRVFTRSQSEVVPQLHKVGQNRLIPSLYEEDKDSLEESISKTRRGKDCEEINNK